LLFLLPFDPEIEINVSQPVIMFYSVSQISILPTNFQYYGILSLARVLLYNVLELFSISPSAQLSTNSLARCNWVLRPLIAEKLIVRKPTTIKSCFHCHIYLLNYKKIPKELQKAFDAFILIEMIKVSKIEVSALTSANRK